MGMYPNSRELLGPSAGLDLAIKEFRDRFVVKGHMRPSTVLEDNELYIFDE